jgi:hypothetical protein
MNNTANTLIHLGYTLLEDFEIGRDDVVVWAKSVVSPPTQSEIDVASLPAAKSRAKRAIKAEAKRRILSATPEWKQRNQIARSIRLARKEASGNATPAEVAELDNLESARDTLDAVRTASDAAEAAIDAMTTIEAVDSYDTGGW